jgi:DNA-binding HxlR family transcriptional regulator
VRRKRFDSQLAILLAAMEADRSWRTLDQLHAVTGIRETSLSAQLRNLRKAEHGAYVVEKRRSPSEAYTVEYRLGR